VNAGQLEAAFAKNKPAIIGAGVVGVVGFALYSRRKDASVPDGAGAGTAAAAYSAGMQTVPMSGAGGVYDSSASDLFGAISPQLESLQGQLTDLQGAKATPGTVPVPKPSNNTAWMNAAVQGWTQQGKNALDIQAALSQYVAGRPVSSGQQAGINWAIKTYGAAPQGTKAVSRVVPVPAKKK
jgi:hypothetical protein